MLIEISTTIKIESYFTSNTNMWKRIQIKKETHSYGIMP